MLIPGSALISGQVESRPATDRLFARLCAATPDLLAGKSPRSNDSIGKTVNVLAYHEGLHVGQMFFLRKLLGHPAQDPIMD